MGNLTFPQTSTNHRNRHVFRDSGRGVQGGVDMCMLCVSVDVTTSVLFLQE